MKKYSTFLFLISFYLLHTQVDAQVIRHEQSTTDSTKQSENFGSTSVVLEDAMQEAELDSNESYIQEFMRDSFRFQWGLRGSVTRGQLGIENITPIRVNSTGSPALVNGKLVRDSFRSNSKFSQQYSAGVFGRVSRGSFFLQPELVYTQKGGVYDILSRDESLITRIDATVNVIDVPVLLGIKFRKARIFFGPVTSFAFSISEDFQKGLRPYASVLLDQSLLQRPVMNFMSGIGFEFDQFFFDFRYENGLANYTDINIGPVSNPARFRFSSNLIMFTLGIIQ